MHFIYDEKTNSEHVLEGLVYEQSKEEECINFKIASEKKEAKISVEIKKGSPCIKCFKFFDKVLSKYAKRIKLNIKPTRTGLQIEREYINAVYSIWEKLSEENSDYIKEKLKVFRNTITSYLDDIRKVCSQAAERDVSRLVARTGIPDFRLLNDCFWRLEQYKKAKEEPVQNFDNAYEAIASIHTRIAQSLNNIFDDLKAQITTENKQELDVGK